MEIWIDRLDAINRGIGLAARWLALLMVLLQFGIVLLRYVFGVSFIFLGEGVLYLHATLFMVGAGYTLLVDGHVRVDVFYSRLSRRGRRLIDLGGGALFLLPTIVVVLFYSWPSVRNAWAVWEGAISVGGIPAAFLLKSLIPTFCLLLLIQCVANLLRDLLRLRHGEPEGTPTASPSPLL